MRAPNAGSQGEGTCSVPRARLRRRRGGSRRGGRRRGERRGGRFGERRGGRRGGRLGASGGTRLTVIMRWARGLLESWRRSYSSAEVYSSAEAPSEEACEGAQAFSLSGWPAASRAARARQADVSARLARGRCEAGARLARGGEARARREARGARRIIRKERSRSGRREPSAAY